MVYKSKYRPVNKEKYKGNPENIICRSLWERKTAKFLDMNSQVKWWSSEELFIRYLSPVDGKYHRYYPDFLFMTTDNKQYLIEVKPANQTKEPTYKKRKSKRYMRESTTYSINLAKWMAAKEFAKSNGLNFQIWDENTLKKLGIM